MIRSYLPALVFLGLGAALGLIFVSINSLTGRFLGGGKRPRRSQGDPYECGLPSDVKKDFRFGISFYLVAMLFILFDLEIVFMYPWAVVYKESVVQSKTILWSMLSFVSILMVGYVYALKKGALEWKK